ncbi:hypothetical protein HBI91_081620 [Parastagonospora nodorum]|nr:hypothetical protein HBI91_081620 [Parastagonospora nodorum]
MRLIIIDPCKLSNLYKAGISPVMDTLTVTPIKDDDNLLNTIDSHIKLRKLKETTKLLGDSNKGIARTLKTEIYTTNIYMQ